MRLRQPIGAGGGMASPPSSRSGPRSGPRSSAAAKKGGSGNKKRHMLRSPLAFLSPNEAERSEGAKAGQKQRSPNPNPNPNPNPSKAGLPSPAAARARRKLFGSPTLRGAGRGHRPKRAKASRKDEEGKEDEGILLAPQDEGRGRLHLEDDSMSSPILGKLRLSGLRPTEDAQQELAAAEPEAEAEAEPEPEPEPESESEAEPEVPPVEFVYPSADEVGVPPPEVVERFHSLASAVAGTHQAQLDSLGLAALSLEDVLLPAAAHAEDAALRRAQGRLQREGEEAAGGAIDACRAARAHVLSLASAAAAAARESRLEREKAFGAVLRRRDEERAEARIRAREGRRERAREEADRSRARAARERDRRLLVARKAHPPNQELWREVATLMKDVARLQKEERMWERASEVLAGREREAEARDRDEPLEERLAREEAEAEARARLGADGDGSGALAGAAAGALEADAALVAEGRRAASKAAGSLQEALEDVMTAAGRVDGTLRGIADLVSQSADVRRELYSKYRSDHQFHGYRGNKDTKGLIAALSQG